MSATVPTRTDPFIALPEPLRQWLPAAVERIVTALAAERIVLFGSFARGSASRKSDIDLLVVARTDDVPIARIGRILQLLSDTPRPLEVVALTPAELERRRHSPFIRSILREGIVLYERRETGRRSRAVASPG